MKKTCSYRFIIAVLVCGSVLSGNAANNVLQISRANKYTPNEWNNIESIGFDAEGEKMLIQTKNDEVNEYSLCDMPVMVSGQTLPLIEITTDEYLEEIPDKVNYKSGMFRMQGFGCYDDAEADVNIRGRGNTTWTLLKKPYRLKFEKKISLCGLPKAKNYVLIANYQDPSYMQNSIAFRLAEMLDIPFTRPMIPVDVVLNGIYKGSYTLTTKPGINAGSVDIDEKNSIMWELDTYFDEDFKFLSPLFQLPVNVSDPDLVEMAGDDLDAADALFEEWKQDFIEMEQAVYDHRAGDYIDLDLYARYFLVYDITKNDELQHPKSVKLYKTRGEGNKYMFGPVWDFDGAWSRWTTDEFYSERLINEHVARCEFFKYLEQEPEFRAAYRKYWHYINDQMPELLEYIDDYTQLIRTSWQRDYVATGSRWLPNRHFDIMVEKMRTWLIHRMEAMSQFEILNEEIIDKEDPNEQDPNEEDANDNGTNEDDSNEDIPNEGDSSDDVSLVE